MISELLRKSIHLSGLILPVIYFFLDKPTMLIFAGILAGIAIAIELVKWVFPSFGNFFFQIFAPLLRTHERKGAITGATYYLISAFLCVLFFAKTLAVVCILFYGARRPRSGVGRKKVGENEAHWRKEFRRKCCVFRCLCRNRVSQITPCYRDYRCLSRYYRRDAPISSR